MKINNKNLKKRVMYFNLFLVIIIGATVSISFNFIEFDLPFNKFYMLGVALLAVAYIAIRGFQYFEFDTSGEGLSLKVQRIDFFSFLNGKEKRVDLPKYKLNNYHFRKGILNEELVLLINSRKSKSNVVKVKLRLSFLSNKTRNNIISELDKIISKNQYQLENKIA